MRDCYSRRQIPFTCVECPIRQVQMSCLLNTDFGDWKFWDRRKQKWPMFKQKLQNRGLLMELCRKNGCNPEILKYILIAKEYSAESCMCTHTDPFPKHTPPFIPFATDGMQKDQETDDYGYAFEHWFPQYILRHLTKSPGNDMKPKIFDKITPDWLDSLYDLYNSIVGPKPEDELELYLQELIRRRKAEEDLMRLHEGEADENDYYIEREGRFEEQPEEVDDENNEDTDKEQEDKKDTKRKRWMRRASRMSDDDKRRHMHNPVDIYYFDPLSEAQRRYYQEELPLTLGPRRYQPPPEDMAFSAHSRQQRRFSDSQQYYNRQPVKFTPSNYNRMGGNYDRMHNRNMSRSVHSLYQGQGGTQGPGSFNRMGGNYDRMYNRNMSRSVHTLYQGQGGTQSPPKKQAIRFTAPLSRKQSLYHAFRGKRSSSPPAPAIGARKSVFHTFGFS